MTWKQITAWVGGVGTFVVSALGYIVSVETRLSEYKQGLQLNDRVINIEQMLYPALVEIGVWKKMQEHQWTPPTPSLTPEPEADVDNRDIRREVEQSVEGLIKRSSPKFDRRDAKKF
jgi:hypothetical protein